MKSRRVRAEGRAAGSNAIILETNSATPGTSIRARIGLTLNESETHLVNYFGIELKSKLTLILQVDDSGCIKNNK